MKPIRHLTGFGLGGLHVGMAYLDETQGWEEPFKRAQDYPQTIGFVLGMADALLELTEKGEFGETLAVASEPLLMRSIYDAVRHYVGSPSPKRAGKKTAKGRWKLVRTGQTGQGAGAQVVAPLIGL